MVVTTNKKIYERLTEFNKDFRQHEKQDEERFDKISISLTRLETTINNHLSSNQTLIRVIGISVTVIGIVLTTVLAIIGFNRFF